MKRHYEGQKVLIIGLGISGRAAAQLLLRHGANILAVDQKHQEADGFQVLRDSDPIDIKEFDFVVVSPGIPQTHPLYVKCLENGLEVIGEMELACRHIRQRCLGITGSNGKTTTTSLVAHVLQHSGRKARALGNIGIPITQAVDSEEDEILVVELSSWQLETLKSRVFDAGAILNITPNHLDRHGTMEAYAAAKFNLVNCLKAEGGIYIPETYLSTFFPFYKGKNVLHMRCDGKQVYGKDGEMFALPSHLQGNITHDVENIMAAFALCQTMGVTGEEFAIALPTFCKPPHRIEFVKKIEGVAYYDDSKGTNIDAVMKAVSSLKGMTHLIAGGVHKGASYTPWREAFKGRVCGIYAIGQAAAKIQGDLGDLFPVEVYPSLGAALEQAASRSKPGENVLLSPGCASYDMFKDYNHRGDEFKRLVNELGKKE